MRLMRHITTRHRNARRGQKALPEGSTVWLIRDGMKVYHFCYLRMEDAKLVKSRLEKDRTDVLIDFNFKSDPDYCLHVEGPIT